MVKIGCKKGGFEKSERWVLDSKGLLSLFLELVYMCCFPPLDLFSIARLVME